MPPPDAFVLKMADAASNSIMGEIIDAVKDHVSATGLTLPNDGERDRIVKHFGALSPGSRIQSLGDIVNAGWQIRLNWTHWDKFNFKPEIRLEILNDLVFKTMEVMEFEYRMAGTPAHA
jgi:hypothetical protein